MTVGTVNWGAAQVGKANNDNHVHHSASLIFSVMSLSPNKLFNGVRGIAQIGEEGDLSQSARLGHDQPPAFGVIELEWEMGPPKLTTDVIAQHHPAVRGGYTISLVKARLVTF